MTEGSRGTESRKTSLMSETGPSRNGRKKGIGVGYYRVDTSHCRLNISQILCQVVGSIGFLKSKYGILKGGRCEVKKVYS